MKFADIKKVSRAKYQANVSWNFLSKMLNNYKEAHCLDICPDFQRGHIWAEEQQIKYVEFVLRGGMSGKDIYFNCPGWMNNFKGPMVLVDGLQRITAVLRFLDNYNPIPVFGNIFHKDFEDKNFLLTVDFVFHINDLESRNDVLQWYIDLNSGIAHTQEEIESVRKMITCNN